MSLINYPDVPNLPGVPAINRSSAGYVAAGIAILGEILPLGTFGLNWGITFLNGTSALTPDSFVDFETREEYTIPTYPTELGGFASYNKVALPYEITLTVTCNGNGEMSTSQFLTAIYYLLETTTLVSVVTPDWTFPVANLIHMEYRKEATNGATMIIARLKFREVRLNARVYPVTVKPEGFISKALGQLSAFTSNITDSINSIF